VKRRSCGALSWMVVGVLLCAGAGEARAQEPEPEPEVAAEPGAPAFRRHVLYYQTGTFARWNPIGLGNLSQVGYRYMFFDSEAELLRGSYAMVGLAPGLNPAFSRIGPMVEVQPLAVLRLTAMWERIDHFGTFDILQSWPSPRDDHSDTARAARGEEGESYATSATQVTLAARAQAKVWRIAARVNYRAVYSEADLKEGDHVYWDSFFDQVMPDGGWLQTTDTDVLYVDGPLALGLRHNWLSVDYPDGFYRPGESRRDPNDQHRLGPLFAWKFAESPGSAFDEPTLFVLVNWWLQHRYRTGEDVSQWVPYTIVGFSFKGELLP